MGKFTSAVILAAGNGTRFGGDTKKQYALLCGKPCIAYTVSAFENCPLIDEIILVGEKETLSGIVGEYGFSKVKAIVPGGETRQESAILGFDETDKNADYVAIHDGARCLVTEEMIEKTVRAARKYRAAASAHRSTDTLKLSDEGEMIEKTLDRDKIWSVQTPQVFDCDMYRVAAYMAKKDGASVTDDCALCERLGFKVKLVETGNTNIKLTTPEDKDLAEALLTLRGK